MPASDPLTAPAPVTAQFKRQLTPHQAAQLPQRVGDRTPNVGAATLADDMATGTPVFAYLPPVASPDKPSARDSAPDGRMAAWIRDTLAAAVAAADAGQEWERVARVMWSPHGDVSTNQAVGYHRDRHGLPGDGHVWIAMVVARSGMRGGYLDLPEYGTTLASRDGSIVIVSDGLAHGITTARLTREDGYQRSLVFTGSAA